MQNFISATTLRDVTTQRQDFLSALAQIGFVSGSAADLAKCSVNAQSDNLVKAVIVGGLYPRIVRIAMPTAQFERVQQGAVQKDVRLHVYTYKQNAYQCSMKRKRSSFSIRLAECSSTPARFYLPRAVSKADTWRTSRKRKPQRYSYEMQQR